MLGPTEMYFVTLIVNKVDAADAIWSEAERVSRKQHPDVHFRLVQPVNFSGRTPGIKRKRPWLDGKAEVTEMPFLKSLTKV